ncbi:rust resistance kinase Lr10-like isoform X2 [Oryza brachyantha]|uniref:rust resistance kinase Lr10-like isoform X2 n=1 Tax=Oryza brachyantha TaxID=4533 RepID=UPI0007763D3E|nr:rust resistance kinase Lr10-like isoform X2 [Oryza brachyantha]
MHRFLVTSLLFSLLNYDAVMGAGSDEADFFRNCPPSQCSGDGPNIRFPFRLESSSSSCGAPGMQLSCSGQDTLLLHPVLGLSKVTGTDYSYGFINIVPLAESWSQCALQKIISTNYSTSVYEQYGFQYASLVSCSGEFLWNITDNIFGPISCLSNASQSLYLVAPYLFVSIIPLYCKVISTEIMLPYTSNQGRQFDASAKRFTAFSELTFTWSAPNITDVCINCEQQQRLCGFSSQRRIAFCKPHGSKSLAKVIIAVVPTIVVLTLVVASALYLALKTKNDDEIQLKVEMFLKTFGTSKPTRYTFSEVKRITKRFKHKLGTGGFGSVYKGELPKGVPVAVKMLENSNGEGEEFINEVATIGRIHHVNVVRLLGFCSEGTRHALIYEFMPNSSLEKYIFSHYYGSSQETLVPDKMLKIALGIAQGIEYLHQGCSQRILHFDIKPHNILLDHSFNPKISDFGLAKLCARDQSIVTLTVARGTMGYIAPELYSRNFGVVSYKSDVYSFGMLVLEMLSGKRNSDPRINSKNEVFVLEWIYETIVSAQESEFAKEMTEGEQDKLRKLAIVALWCVQWNPANRPSMRKVVNMLTGSLRNLKNPPRPFVSSLG